MFRNIPTVTKNLLLINVVVFLAALAFQSKFDITDWGRLHFVVAPGFNPLQFVTYQFLHGDIAHIFFNMFALWMFGCVIERVWGPKKFLFYYLVCGIGAGICQELVQYVEYSTDAISSMSLDERVPVRTDYGTVMMSVGEYLDSWGTIGASGAVYGILLAFGMTFPEERIFIFPLPVPIRAKWFVCIYAAIELVLAYSSSGDGVAHIAHLGGMLFGLIIILYWRKHPSNFDISGGLNIIERLLRSSGSRQQTPPTTDTHQPGFGPTREDDMEYNRRKVQRQKEVDAILDKIRKSGYDSLTEEEKQRLFEASHER